MRRALLLSAVALLAACEAEDALVGEEAAEQQLEGLPSCTEADRIAIVSDIDETMTTSDLEFLQQYADASYDPLERDGGCAMIRQLHDLGYFVFFVTARPADMDMGGTGKTSEQATNDWLVARRCPTGPRTLVTFAPELVYGETARNYKKATLQGFLAEGYDFRYAFGNAESDIDAYEDAGIPKAVTFIIGKEAGAKSTIAIEGEGWRDFSDGFVPTVPAICRP